MKDFGIAVPLYRPARGETGVVTASLLSSERLERGKGLGLALTKEILEANGGKISLSSEAGFGSEVTILLPFSKRS